MVAEGEKKKTSRDAEEGDGDLSGSELNEAEISAAAEELALLALSAKGGEVNSDSDEAETLSDPDLWKPHPPTEDCPVCFVPLPIAFNTCLYHFCCGKTTCVACSMEHYRALRILNAKREEKELPKLKESCPFCRAPAPSSDDLKLINDLFEEAALSDGAAACELAKKYMKGAPGLDQDEGKAVELFHRAADMGYAPANVWLSKAYAFMEDLVGLDLNKAKMYAERAVKLNYPQARALLASYAVQGKQNQLHVALQHSSLGAAAGCKELMDTLWELFYGGKVRKEDLEDTLRKYHQSCENMNSEARERYNAWMKAKEENNEILREIYSSYYQGVINAKQLKEVLKQLMELV